MNQPGIRRERDPSLEPPSTPTPSQEGPLSFAADIKGLFRDIPDRSSMLRFFDLHKYEDVRENAPRILERLKDGTMPCDGNWPLEKIAKFETWINEGMKQ